MAQNGQLIDEMRKIISEKEEIIESLLGKIDSMKSGEGGGARKAQKIMDLDSINSGKIPIETPNVFGFHLRIQYHFGWMWSRVS